MKVKLSRKFSFEASHCLTHLPTDHPCHRLHGHGYNVEVEVSGEVDQKTGFLIDYSEIKRVAEPVVMQLDHRHLNDIEGLRISSTEFIARWLWERIKPDLACLSKITVSETPKTRCEYWGE